LPLETMSKESLLLKLNQLTRGMDVPAFRRGSPKWLSKNLGIRNSKHKNYQEAMETITELIKIGL
jgi:hypothetical protein